MKKLRAIALVALATAALSPWGTDHAAGTTFEIGGVTQNKSISMSISAVAGSTTILKDTSSTIVDTCTGAEMFGATETPFTGSSVTTKLASLSFAGCSHTTDVLKPGKLSTAWTSGTNGSVSSKEAEVTVFLTTIGASVVCKTGTGTKIGTITGALSPPVNFDLAAVTDCGIAGDLAWAGSYRVTSPEGLGVES